MNRHEARENNSWGWGVLIVALVVVTVGAYYYIEREDRSGAQVSSSPNTEWTTKPEGGVEVTIPETPMTNVPVETQSPLETETRGEPSDALRSELAETDTL